MEWGAEQIALAIAGALFLFGVVASLHPRLALSLTSRVVLSAAACRGLPRLDAGQRP